MTGEIKFPKPPSIQRDLQGYLLAPVELKTLIEFGEKTEEAKTHARKRCEDAKPPDPNPEEYWKTCVGFDAGEQAGRWRLARKVLEMLTEQ